MKKNLIVIFTIMSVNIFSQEVERIDVPSRVVYNYCDASFLDSTYKVLDKELSGSNEYVLLNNILFVGPVIWTRYSKIKKLSNIEGGNMTLLVDNEKLSGKLTQSVEDTKMVWDQMLSEIKDQKYILRKATFDELNYYWSVISFDIDEPLVIIETAKHNYILDISPETMKLNWLDEAPK